MSVSIEEAGRTTNTSPTRYSGELQIYSDAEQLANATAELFVGTAAESIKVRGRFRVALSGGSTPRRVYQLLATQSFSSRVDWNQVGRF